MREEGGKDGEEIGEWRGKEGKNEGKGKEERKEGKEGGNRRRLWEGGRYEEKNGEHSIYAPLEMQNYKFTV